MRARTACYASGRIDRDQRADREARAGGGARRAEPALEVVGPGAVAGAHRAEREAFARRGDGVVAEVAIGRAPAPFLVAAMGEIEQRRAGNDRHPASPLAKPRPGPRDRPSRRPPRRARTPNRRKARRRRSSGPSFPAPAAPRRAGPARRPASRCRRPPAPRTARRSPRTRRAHPRRSRRERRVRR